ncbi:hypothetical protein B0I35DRAFT_483288 [Stachybotrys elegans]|uniref:Uncharacterized protein n=1 Tax=Stachybotrys elegans TaxID=80388 RepID=A0A8K0SC53_9HYPO|nr:hypothetical protein B0I35DRAFT_483288 [Stachybotrys elegans]
MAWGRNSNSTPYGRNDYKVFIPGKVDCRCKWSEAQWGHLDDYAPAGILYNDITIKQPIDYWLSSARICITMSETASSYALGKQGRKDIAAAADDWNSNRNLQVASYYGPMSLLGPETVTVRSKTKKLEPYIGVMGMAELGGIGKNTSVSSDRRTQWEFKGERRTPRDGTTYRTLERVYIGNEQDHGSFKMHMFSTAFAFQHRGDVPVFMRIEIEGELGSKFRRGMQSFSSHFGNKDKSVLTEIRFDKDFLYKADSLKAVAQSLDISMQKRHYDNLAVRLPEARPWEYLPSAAPRHEAETAQGPEVAAPGTTDNDVNIQELLEIFNGESKADSTSTKPPSYTTVTPPDTTQLGSYPGGCPTESVTDKEAMSTEGSTAKANDFEEKHDRPRDILENPTLLMVATFIAMIIDFFYPSRSGRT